jgi:acyl-coenzyme A thioesterase PaaI-like protein
MPTSQWNQALTQWIAGPLARRVPERYRETFLLRAFGLKIPLLFWTMPSVVELTESRCEVRIPLGRRTRNHLGSMYFGALSIGADCAGGLIAMKLIHQRGENVSLIFKDFQAEFLKRAEGDVHFSCEEGAQIAELVQRTLASSERQNLPVHVVATVPSRLGQEPVARFTLTLSLKKRISPST